MKTRIGWKKVISAFCITAMLAGFMPIKSFAMDLSAYYEQIATMQQQYQEALQAQAEAQQELEKQLAELALFDVEAAYRFLVSCRNGEERAYYFYSLNEAQRLRLVDYLEKLVAEGKFHGFEDFEVPGLSITKDEAEKKEKYEVDISEENTDDSVAAAGETEAAEKSAEQTDFENDYANQIALYREFGQWADLSGIPFEVAEQIRTMVDAENSEKPAEEVSSSEAEEAAETEQEAAPAEETPAVDASITETEVEPVEELPTAEAENAPAEDASTTEPGAAPSEEVTAPEEEETPAVEETTAEEHADGEEEVPVEEAEVATAEELSTEEAESAEETPDTEEPTEEMPAAETEPEIIEPTEEEMFIADYGQYIELYRQYGTAADFSALPHDVFLKIQEMVDGQSGEADETVTAEAEDLPEDTIAESEENAETEQTTPDETEVEPTEEELTEEENSEAVTEEETEESAEEEPTAEEATDGENEEEKESDKELSAEDNLPSPEIDHAVLLDKILDDMSSQRWIDVYLNYEGNTISYGDIVTLTANLNGYENCEYTLQWQQSTDGQQWVDIEGANGTNYSFTVSEENSEFNWRMTVHVSSVTVPEELIEMEEEAALAEMDTQAA